MQQVYLVKPFMLLRRGGVAAVSKQSSYSEQDENPEFWFNIKTNQVEVGKQSPAAFRMGPYNSREAAEQALATAARRAAQWREEENRD
jgi:hypothetical protein